IRGSEVLRTRFLPLARVIPPRCLADREVGLPGSLPRGFATGAEARRAVRVDRSRGRLPGPIVDPVASATRSLTAAFLGDSRRGWRRPATHGGRAGLRARSAWAARGSADARAARR